MLCMQTTSVHSIIVLSNNNIWHACDHVCVCYARDHVCVCLACMWHAFQCVCVCEMIPMIRVLRCLRLLNAVSSTVGPSLQITRSESHTHTHTPSLHLSPQRTRWSHKHNVRPIKETDNFRALTERHTHTHSPPGVMQWSGVVVILSRIKGSLFSHPSRSAWWEERKK